jgi:4-hydroxybenzoate polyprenyltransferase
MYYYIGLVLFVGLLFFQHTLVKPSDISKVNLAFGTTNGIASLLFALFVILSIFFAP